MSSAKGFRGQGLLNIWLQPNIEQHPAAIDCWLAQMASPYPCVGFGFHIYLALAKNVKHLIRD